MTNEPASVSGDMPAVPASTTTFLTSEQRERVLPWLEQGRWLLEDQRSRYDVLGQQALGIATVMVVLVTLSTPNVAASEGLARVGYGCALVLAAGSVALAIAAARPAKVHMPSTEELTRGFGAALAGQGGTVADIAEHLWHSRCADGESQSPLSSLERAAATRAKWLKRAGILAIASTFITAFMALIG